MAVYDRWHLSHPGPGDEPCEHSRGKSRLYASRDHGKGDRWQVRWRDLDGKPCKRNRPRRGGKQGEADPEIYAEALDAKVQAELNAGTYVDPGAGRITLAEYAAQWRSSQNGDLPTLSRIDSTLKVHIFGKPIGGQPMVMLANRPSMIRQWIAGMSNLEPITVRTNLRILSSIMIAAVDDKVIPHNPTKVRSVRPPPVVPKDVVPWPLERAEAARAAMPADHAAMVDAGVGCGLRQGEVFALALDAIDWLGREIRVIRQVRLLDSGELVFAPPKGGKARTVPLHERDSLRLAAHIAEHGTTEVTLPWKTPDGGPHTAELLFTTASGGALHRIRFNQDEWRPARRAAGAPDTRGSGFHVLRHTFASAQLAGGVDIKALAVSLGHADPGFTLRTYTHLMPSAADKARKAMDEFYGITDESAQNVPGEGSS
jgi:integrase